jgi:hypothetical protein
MNDINARISFPLSLQPVLLVQRGIGTSLEETSYVPVIWIRDAADNRLLIVKPAQRATDDQTEMTLDVAGRATAYVRWLEEAAQSLAASLEAPTASQVVQRVGSIEVVRADGALAELNLLVALTTRDGEEFDRVRCGISLLEPVEGFNVALNYVVENSARLQARAAMILEELVGTLAAWQETDRVAPSGTEELRVQQISVK